MKQEEEEGGADLAVLGAEGRAEGVDVAECARVGLRRELSPPYPTSRPDVASTYRAHTAT
eukprot:1090901-Rhodomonas_salina.3